MAYEQRDNSGSVFKNDRKEKDSHPDRQGTCMIDGKEYWISGWVKTSAKGDWLSLAFKPKEKATRPAAERDVPARGADPISSGRSVKQDMNDDIPFAPEWR